MEKLAPGEVGEARPVPPPPPVQQQPAAQPGRGRGPYGRPGYPPPGYQPPPAGNPSAGAPLPGEPQPPAQSANGTISMHVQPTDVDVFIDGQQVPGGTETLSLDVSEGRHNVQVRKVGYVGYLTDVEVRRGETTTVSVMLRPRQ